MTTTPSTPSSSINYSERVDQLSDALSKRKIHNEITRANGTDTKVDYVNVWHPEDPFARYPVTTIWAPREPGDTWQWGDNFECTMLSYSTTAQLADSIENYLKLRGPRK